MAFKNASRVQETVSNLPNAATAFNLSGAVTSGLTFVAGIGSTNTCVYCAQALDGTGANEAAWEIGVGTVASGTPDTLTRTQIIESSNSDAAVDFSSSTAIEIFTVNPGSNVDAVGSLFNHLRSGIYNLPITDMNIRNANVSEAQYYWPIVIPRPVLITSVAADSLSAVAGRSARIGLHQSEDGLPTTLLQEFGSFTTDVIAFKEITGLSYFTPPGAYFLTLQCERNTQDFMGWGGAVSDIDLWSGYGVSTTDRDLVVGVLYELLTFGANMVDATSPVPRINNAPTAYFKFSEV